jgi:hypothetical protein
MGKTQLLQDEYEKIKTLLYHVVPKHIQEDMVEIRVQYIQLALTVLRNTEYSRSQSIALTHLEESLMRTIQGMAMRGTPQLPPDFEVV